jgi:hypothetical protein
VHNSRTGHRQNHYGEVNYIYSEESDCYKYVQYSSYYSLDDSGAYSGPRDYTGLVSLNPFSVFEYIETLRPGTGPRPADAVSNAEKLVHLRGSSFRFRTGHSKRSCLRSPNGRVNDLTT